MQHPLRFSALSFALALAGTTAASAANPVAIAFTRASYDQNGVATSSHLLLDEAGQVRELTRPRDRLLDSAPSWSPDGARIVFQRTLLQAGGRQHSALYAVGRDGRPSRLSRGPADALAPAWGPDGRIAYVARTPQRDCLATMDGNGARARTLLCVDAPAQLQAPAWTANGRDLLVASGAYGGGSEGGSWRGTAWRVDPRAGAATRLATLALDEERRFVFSPDGRRAVLADIAPRTLVLYDFATGTQREVATGYAPRWSRDGRRFAFTGEVFDNGSDGFRYYNPLFVADAKGGDVRQLTRGRLADNAYFAADWSRDGTRILATRRGFLDPGLTQPIHRLRIIDAGSGAVLAQPVGYAAPGAWFDQ